MRKKHFFILLIIFLFCFGSSAQNPGEISYHDESAMPEGKAGERIRSLLKTYNSGDSDAIRLFMEGECTEKFRGMAPMEEHIRIFQDIFRSAGRLSFHSIRTYQPERPEETVVIVKSGNFDEWRAFTLRFEKSPQKLIDDMRFSPARKPSNVTEIELTEKQAMDEIDDLIKRICAKDIFSGTVLVARGEAILFTAVCGEASKRFHVPNNLDTKFNLGSMNKMFTSTAIVRLAEEGRLSLEDPLSKYLEETWFPKEVTDKITVHHLLTHTSGLGNYFNEKYRRGSRLLFRNPADFKHLIEGDRPVFIPGKRFQYSNTGMLLLGIVIEKASSMDYFDYIRKVIYAPAGMKNSDSYEMDIPIENLAIGYEPDSTNPTGWRNNIFQHVVKGGPAGGGFSTVSDLHRFALAILAEKYVSRKSLEMMWTDHSGAGYGYGFGIEKGPNGKIVGHSGGFPGINGVLDIYLDKGYIVAVLSNYSQGANPVARKIKSLLARVKQR